MIRVRSQRFWTTMLVVGLCAPTTSLGWGLASYGLSAALADPPTAESRLGAFADSGAVFAPLARRERLRFQASAEPVQAEKEIAALLADTPMNGGAWLDLAIARRAAGETVESVAAALAMSAVVAPNEARFMAGRASFALVFWSALPPDARTTIISDLIGGWSAIDAVQRNRIAEVLNAEPNNARELVRAALLTNGDAGLQVANALFPPPPKPSPSSNTALAPAAEPSR